MPNEDKSEESLSDHVERQRAGEESLAQHVKEVKEGAQDTLLAASKVEAASDIAGKVGNLSNRVGELAAKVDTLAPIEKVEEKIREKRRPVLWFLAGVGLCFVAVVVLLFRLNIATDAAKEASESNNLILTYVQRSACPGVMFSSPPTEGELDACIQTSQTSQGAVVGGLVKAITESITAKIDELSKTIALTTP